MTSLHQVEGPCVQRGAGGGAGNQEHCDLQLHQSWAGVEEMGTQTKKKAQDPF